MNFCRDVFGKSNTENKKKLKKAISEDELQAMLDDLNRGVVDYGEVVREIKKRFETPLFYNIPALSVIQNLFFDEETEVKFGDKVIEDKYGFILFNDDGKVENPFCNVENYLLYILMFTFSGRKTTAKELYKFCISSNTRINQKNIDEFERKIVDLAQKIKENEVRVCWGGNSCRMLTNFEKNGSELYFDCSNFRMLLDNKLISISQRLVGKSKFSVVLKKLMIIKEIRTWKKFGSQYGSKIVIGKIEDMLDSEISNSFLKEFLNHLKDNNFIGEYTVKT